MDDLRSLVTQAQAGDVRAYGEIVRRFQDMAYGYAYSLLGDFHLAEDAAQEAFIEAYRCLPKLREPAAFSGWLRRIVFKRCDRLTRPKQVCTVPLESVGSVASKSPGPPQKAERREMRDKALDAIRSLPDAERTVTTLHYIDGYSQKDVADFLEVPVTTVNNRLHASRQRLKERMIAMVADELNASKPGGEFQELVEEAIRRQGKGAFNDAVALCGRALGAAQEGDLERVADLYFEIYDSYQKTGEVEALPTGMFSAVPDQPSDGRVVAALNVLHCVVQGFLHAHLPERAQGTAQRMSELVAKLRGRPSYWPWRGEALWWLRRASVAEGDEQAGKRFMRELRRNLEAAEEAFATVREASEARRPSETVLRQWREEIAGAYHNLAMRIAFDDKIEALRLMRRALELYDHLDTRLWMAGLVLSVDNDREGALAHLKAAVGRDPEGARAWFHEHPAVEAVRDDHEFLAVLAQGAQ